MAALIAGTIALPTCPAVETTTVYVTAGSANDPDYSVVVQTVTATALPSVQPEWSPASPTFPATLTVTIDNYGPPAGGSHYTGPKPWESVPAAPSTVYTIVAPIPVTAVPGTPLGSPGGSTADKGRVSNSPGDVGRGTPIHPTLSVGDAPPNFSWNPTKTPCPPETPVAGDPDGFTVITKSLLHTHSVPGQQTPFVDTVVASFTVAFPQPSGTGSLPSGPGLTNTVVPPVSIPAEGVLTYTVTAPIASEDPSSGSGNTVSFTEPVPDSGNVFTYTVTAASPSNIRGADNSGSTTAFTTTLYRTRPASGLGTPTVDTLVTCFTVTFPSETGIAPSVTGIPSVTPTAPGVAPDALVRTVTRYVPTIVPGPDGQPSHSIEPVVITFTAPLGDSSAAVPPAGPGSITTVVVPASPTYISSDPLGGINVVTTTLYAPGSGGDTSNSLPGGYGESLVPSPSVSIIVLPGSIGAGSISVTTATVLQPTPGNGLSVPAFSGAVPTSTGGIDASGVIASVITATIFQTVPGSDASVSAPGGAVVSLPGGAITTLPGSAVSASLPGGYGDPILPSVSASVIAAPGSGGSLPSSAQTHSLLSSLLTVSVHGQTHAPNDLPGGYGDLTQIGAPLITSVSLSTLTIVPPVVLAPASTLVVTTTSLPGASVTTSGPAVVVPTTLATALPVRPSVITLWPPASNIDSADPGASTKTSCSTTLLTETTSTSVLTSTFVNVLDESTTTYTFPFETLITSTGVFTVNITAAATEAAGATGAAGAIETGVITEAGAVTRSGVATAITSVAQSVFISTGVITGVFTSQVVFTTGVFTSVVQPFKRQLNSTIVVTPTLVSPVATPVCTGTTEVGNLNLDFDDVPYGPLYNPYHRLWFSKGFLVGPPPSMPFLPSSGGRLVEYVPPILSNSTSNAFSADTAQIGMGKLASSPCFQFDFLGVNLGCHSSVPGQHCVFTFTGYTWDPSDGQEREAMSQDAWVNACNNEANCLLTAFSATGFKNLSSILITLRVDGRPDVWWGDDLRVSWSKNDCEAAACRQQATLETTRRHQGPVWYWTPFGLRVISPSRVNKYYLE
ncbi:hypothetical protein CCHL11_05695 [Colletotrichum chlorophyti]|uniref:DUF7371 domain-containing protein n=1 Tax=Colletotrichum chlorophyti TaxID=708187 RepID=A0A1Q8RTI9_9PEZI|nr:hypothetical protein CCHL11_05695 [Colletotrichum chlorophyti]